MAGISICVQWSSGSSHHPSPSPLSQIKQLQQREGGESTWNSQPKNQLKKKPQKHSVSALGWPVLSND